MTKSNDKGPGIVSIAIAGMMMAAIGAFAGVVFMATYPIQAFSSQAELDRHLEEGDEEAHLVQPREVYYIEGPDRSSVSWQQVRKDILDGRKDVIDLPAGVINTWLSSNFQIGHSGEAFSSGIMVLPGMPKVSSLQTGEVFLSMPIEFKVYGTSYNRTYVAIGHIDQTARPKFVIDQIQLDCAGIPVLGVGELLHQRLVSIFSGTDEFKQLAAALAEFSSVEVGDNSFRLRR